jgi:hypothetical protein
MVFHSSPALRRIRQLARLIRRHPDLPVHSWNTPWRDSELPHIALPDPEQFVDSSVTSSVTSPVTSNDRSSHSDDLNTRRKHANRSHAPGGR